MRRSEQVLKLILDHPRNEEQLCRETGFSLGIVLFCLESLQESGLITAEADESFEPAVNYYYPKLGWWYGKPWNH